MNDESRRFSALFDTSSAQEMTKCLGQLCNQVSLSNIKVPRIDSFKDVFDFLGEFESITTGLDDSQKSLLINKAFPLGCNRSWFETELAPHVKKGSSWAEIRSLIIKRFSASEEKDRHFIKLRELSFDPEGDKSLLSFIDDLLYSLKRAFSSQEESSHVRYIKASMPTKIRPIMNSFSEFRNATSIENLKEAARQYDLMKGADSKASQNREATRELANMLQDMMSKIQKDNENTCKAVASALRNFGVPRLKERAEDHAAFRPRSPVRVEYRAPSPRSYQHQSYGETGSNPNKRSTSPGPNYVQQDRGHSPQRQGQYRSSVRYRSPIRSDQAGAHESDARQYKPVANRPPTPGNREEFSEEYKNQDVAFDSKMYFARFGKPPAPCSQCRAWHWNKHCPFYLN